MRYIYAEDEEDFSVPQDGWPEELVQGELMPQDIVAYSSDGCRSPLSLVHRADNFLLTSGHVLVLPLTPDLANDFLGGYHQLDVSVNQYPSVLGPGLDNID